MNDTALTEKSIASVARRFGAELRAIVNASGSVSVGDVRKLVKTAVGDAYGEGLKQGGVPIDEMTDDDAMMIIELGENQLAHVPDFVKAIREARGDRAAQRAILDNRVPLWVASIEAAGEYGLASAKQNEMVEFRVRTGADPSDESCRTCRRLLGKRHRRKWVVANEMMVHPGNENYECGCWRCPHDWLPLK